jgi:hypothetical protein
VGFLLDARGHAGGDQRLTEPISGRNALPARSDDPLSRLTAFPAIMGT